MSFYKGKYMIGIYAPIDQGETLLRLCDNIKEFANVLGITRDNAGMILHAMYTRTHKYIRFNGMKCSVEFIEVEDDE